MPSGALIFLNSGLRYTKAIIVRNKRYQLAIKVVTDSDRLLHVLSTAPYEQASVDTVLSLCQGD